MTRMHKIVGPWVFILSLLGWGILIGGLVENKLGWVGSQVTEAVVEPVPETLPGPLTFTVAMNGQWEYTCLSMEYLGPDTEEIGR